MSVFIIAEAGVNHNGDVSIAKEMIDTAVACGVDAIKFQTWKTEALITEGTKKANYQSENCEGSESQFEMLKRLELSYEEFVELKEYCDQCNIIFLSTADEEESASFLLDLQDIFKIGSGELSNLPFLEHIGSFNKQVILSTGMSELHEVEQAVNILVKAGTVKSSIVVLHANTQYPTPFNDVNLNAMKTIEKALGVRVGYSDHTLGIEVPIAAVALGACVIEKHFTLNKEWAGPDHKASLNPIELKQMVDSIRITEACLGDGIKKVSDSERENITCVRKSIVAKRSIKQGEIFTKDNITTKRPATGVSPLKWYSFIGETSVKDYKANDLIDFQ